MAPQSTASISDSAQRTLGVWISPGLGQGYPKLKDQLSDVFDRAATLPWVPSGWRSAVAGLQDQYPNDLVRPYPAMGSIHINPGIPDWISQSQERADAWTQIAKSANNAIVLYAKGQQDAGAAELQRLEDNAAFWDKAFRIAENIRDAAPNAAKWVLSNLWNGLGPEWKFILGVGVVGAAVYFAAKAKTILKAFKG